LYLLNDNFPHLDYHPTHELITLHYLKEILVKLYTHPGSCSSASYISLLEAGLDFEKIKVNLKDDRKLPDGRFLSDINPKNYVPVLELDDGTVLTENVSILQYIADQAPESNLAPAYGTKERYELMEWLAYVNSEVHKGCSAIMFGPAEGKAAATEKVVSRFAYIDKHLADKDYLLGEHMTVADAYLFIVSNWGAMVGFDISGLTNIIAFQQRMMERDSVQKAVADMAH
jgi:glutathione S-transferase